MPRFTMIALLGIFAAAGPLVAEDPPKEPTAVWELYSDGKTRRVQLLDGGTTDEGIQWEQNLTRLTIGDATFGISSGGRSFGGRREGGASVRGRLLMVNIALESEPAQPAAQPTQAQGSATPDEKPTFESQLVGVWEMTAWNRKKDKQLYLSVDLTDEKVLLDESRKLAAWSVDKSNKITFDFVDERFEDAVIGQRNPDKLFGKARAGRDTWTLTFDRIRPVAICKTDALGEITLYSNGRIDGANGLSSSSYWSLQGRQLQVDHYTCTLSADRKSFSGRGVGGGRLTGTFEPVGK